MQYEEIQKQSPAVSKETAVTEKRSTTSADEVNPGIEKGNAQRGKGESPKTKRKTASATRMGRVPHLQTIRNFERKKTFQNNIKRVGAVKPPLL